MNFDFELAYKRVKFEIENPYRVGQSFVTLPHSTNLSQNQIEQLKKALETKICNGSWEPDCIETVDIPKGEGLVRPGSHLSLQDNVMYTAAVGLCLEPLFKQLSEQTMFDFALPFEQTEIARPNWMNNYLKGWVQQKQVVQNNMDSGLYTHVLSTDVSTYFEQIDIDLLIKQLQNLKVDAWAVYVIETCLKKWSPLGNKGIPQGPRASMILGKIYLNSFDLELQAQGYKHFRYVDDLTFLLKNKKDANQTLLSVTQLLRQRGLNLAGHKTSLAPIKVHKANNPIAKLFLGLQNSFSPQIVDGFSNHRLRGIDKTALQNFYNQNHPFDSQNFTPFRMSLGLLGKFDDDFALEDCFEILLNHKHQNLLQTTLSNILWYFQRQTQHQKVIEQVLVESLSNPAISLYAFNQYQILRFIDSFVLNPSFKTKKAVNNLFETSQTSYVGLFAQSILDQANE